MTKEAAFTETLDTYSTHPANHARHDNLSNNHNAHLPSAGQVTRQAGDRHGKIRLQRTVHALDDQASEAAIRAHGRLITALVLERRLFITCCASLQPHHPQSTACVTSYRSHATWLRGPFHSTDQCDSRHDDARRSATRTTIRPSFATLAPIHRRESANSTASIAASTFGYPGDRIHSGTTTSAFL
jgi:hypothetical protein